MRGDETAAQFEAVKRKPAIPRIAVDRQIQSGFVPIRDTVGPFGNAIERFIRDNAAGEGRPVASQWRIVVVPGEIEFARRGDFGIVNLDLVGLTPSRCHRGTKHREQSGHPNCVGFSIHKRHKIAAPHQDARNFTTEISGLRNVSDLTQINQSVLNELLRVKGGWKEDQAEAREWLSLFGHEAVVREL